MTTSTQTAKVPTPAMVTGTDTPLLFTFGKHAWMPDEKCILAKNSKPFPIEDQVALGKLLGTKAPLPWEEVCKPEYIMHVACKDPALLGTGETLYSCPYVNFEFTCPKAKKLFPNEFRFAHIVSATIAERNFPKIRDDPVLLAKSKQKVGSPGGFKTKNELKQFETFNWTKETNCKGKAQLNPETFAWDKIPASQVSPSGAEMPRPCARVRPDDKNKNASTPESVEAELVKKNCKRQHFIEVGPKGSYTITEREGMVHIYQYRVPGDGPASSSVAENASKTPRNGGKSNKRQKRAVVEEAAAEAEEEEAEEEAAEEEGGEAGEEGGEEEEGEAGEAGEEGDEEEGGEAGEEGDEEGGEAGEEGDEDDAREDATM